MQRRHGALWLGCEALALLDFGLTVLPGVLMSVPVLGKDLAVVGLVVGVASDVLPAFLCPFQSLWPSADNQSEVMSAQPRVAVQRVLVRVACAAQDSTDFDPALQALLAQRELLELFEAVALGSIVRDGLALRSTMHDTLLSGMSPRL